MKRIRDILIIVVLGGLVIWYVAGFITGVHQASVQQNITVRQAETACIVDGMICHAGYEFFSSVADAEAYLKSSEHLTKVKAREEEAVRQKKDSAASEIYANCASKAKDRKQMNACDKQSAKQLGAP